MSWISANLAPLMFVGMILFTVIVYRTAGSGWPSADAGQRP